MYYAMVKETGEPYHVFKSELIWPTSQSLQEITPAAYEWLDGILRPESKYKPTS